MIKARTKNQIVLGLSHENLKRLKDQQPIKINLKELKFDSSIDINEIEIFIFAGETEESMYLSMMDKIGPNTELT